MKKLYSLLALNLLALTACGGNLEPTVDGGHTVSSNSAAATSSAVASNSSASTTAPSPSSSTRASASSAASPTRTVIVTTDETLVSSGQSAEASSSATPDSLLNAVEIPLQQGQGEYGDYGYASIKTPSGNIGCSIKKDGKDGYCGVMSYMTDQKYPAGSWSGRTVYGWVINLNGINGYAPQFKSDAPDYELYSITAEYGTTYTYGDFACDSKENGLTCWNITTGKGVFLNRDGYEVIQR